MLSILVIDGERSIRNTLKERLEYEGFVVETAETGDDALSYYGRRAFDVALCDMQIQDCDAYDLISRVHEHSPNFPFIMLSSLKSVDSAVNIMRHGAFDYLAKPLDMNRLLASIREAKEERKHMEEHVLLAHTDGRLPDHVPVVPAPAESAAPAKGRSRSGIVSIPVPEIIGASKAITQVKRLIEKVAPSEARVLILGANGTGKELVAHSLHQRSARQGGAFVEVNCAAIPSELIESELFGHEKGAFTSAIRQRKGKFEQAHGGTLFLDEIGDMSLSAQAKVLRALQEHKISRVGSDQDIRVDVRVVAATNKDLQKEIAAGNFREDLYHRLSVIVVRVPPLKERLEDIPVLVDHFIRQICAEYSMTDKEIENEALAELMKMEWSGNIRELRNVVERLIILSGEKIELDDVQTYALGAA